MTRRDKCFLTGKRAAKLTARQSALAWHALAVQLEEELAEMDVPKFAHLLQSVRSATIIGKREPEL